MKVLMYAPFAKWGPHLETDLEIAENHLRAGDQVVWVGCGGELEACEPNVEHAARDCAKCVGRGNAGVALLAGSVERIRSSDLWSVEDEARVGAIPTRFADHDELKAVMLDTFDIGYATLSSIVWCDRDANVDLGHKTPRLGRFLRSAGMTYLGMRRYLAAHPVDRVYVFNGRMAAPRGALRAAQDLGIPVFVHERGCDVTRYALTPNAMPHEIRAFTQRVNERWESAEPGLLEKTEIAEAWYQRRSKGVIGHWHSFTEQQQDGRLPAGWDESRRNIVLYSSSEYEFASIGEEWKNHLFDVPTEGIVRIAEVLSAAGQVHLAIRMHPNPDGSQSSSAALLRGLDLPGVTVVSPESVVCSYALMNAAEKIVVTSSTMGIEASFWGKPSILAGRSLYCELGAAHHPQTFEELIDAIHDPDLGPVDREPALRYGYDQATFGTPFQHFVPEDLFNGPFKGVHIKPRGMDRMRVKFHSIGYRAKRLLGIGKTSS